MKSRSSRYRILFVCLGNICRSPAAEIVFKKQVADAGRDEEFEVASSGTSGHHQGSPPDPRMAKALEEKGFKVEGSARPILPNDLITFDLIITMDETNLADVKCLDATGKLHSKIRPFVSYCQVHTDLRVPDPYYGGQLGFDHVIRLLEDGCKGILATLERK
jgi:protein-tyrosine phosphatase